MRKFEAFLDATGDFVAGKSTIVVTAKNPSLSLISCLGLLNSKLIRFFIQESFGVLGVDGGISFSGSIVKELPLPFGFEGKLPGVEKAGPKLLKEMNDGPENEDLQRFFDAVDEAVFDAYRLPVCDRKVIGAYRFQC